MWFVLSFCVLFLMYVTGRRFQQDRTLPTCPLLDKETKIK
ncbi:hypothetical protein GLYMA_15G036450v4 [Glycine max]|nr:hypothetical protein GLYMA_15G036450v4 [Glycine max]